MEFRHSSPEAEPASRATPENPLARMPVSWKIEGARMRLEATGHYAFDDVVEALHAATSEPSAAGPLNLILDIRASKETRSADELRSLLDTLAKTPRFGGACAVLVPHDDGLHFGLARMLVAFAEPLAVRVGLFESDAGARAFTAVRGVESGSAR